ncbi:HAMP domain-containing histidine kinase [Enterococcus sp. 669A]|uniref:histidine kinase n=1 Tax=Candidatus Enterococcus moelleringii TaxID=2815325 RepID=A0ABS3LFJ9_9ENTE|nr:HAMP domain-containing sensor histidine kinase [Enterococcus sp. 669A]MBO1308423.1 HAMP domain-containing histidine kinase [Enterococcus sp. 669A]
MINLLLLVLAVSIAGFGLHRYWLAKQTLNKMDRLLDAAIDGQKIQENFVDSYDERIVKKLKTFVDSRELITESTSSESQNIHELIANIAHQTKTPITNISMFSELLKEIEDPEQIHEYIDDINQQSQKLKHLIEELMKTSYLENHLIKTAPKRNSYSDLIMESVEAFQHLASQKQMTIQTEMASEVYGHFDEQWSKEALGNLLDNAIKYGDEGSVIDVRLKELESFIRIDVSNQGTAISEAVHGKIFQRFYRDEATQGTEGLGIGLYLVREIMQLQGGLVKVETQGDRNTFSLFFKK